MRIAASSSLVLALLSSCVVETVSTQPSTLAQHAERLRLSGEARVESDRAGRVAVTGTRRIEVVKPGRTHARWWGLVTVREPDSVLNLTVAELVAGCEGGSAGPCLANQVRDDPIAVGTRRRADPAMMAKGAFGAVALAGSSICLAICEGEDVWSWGLVGTAIAMGVVTRALSTVF